MSSHDIYAFLSALHPNGVYEVRAPKCPDRKGGSYTSTHAGWFYDANAAAKEINRISRFEPPGIYVTLNPCKADLRARSDSSIKAKAQSTTTDGDITRLRRLFIDIDSVRPAGMSATDTEVKEALQVANAVLGGLADWPKPIVGMSGNGWYLIYPIDLANTPDNVSLLKSCLAELSNRYDTPTAQVDTSTFNPARIVKVLGTWARKGDDTKAVEIPGHGLEEARPHRQSWHEIPDDFDSQVVSEEQLRALCGNPDTAEDITEANAGFFQEFDAPGRSFDLATWIAEHNVPVRGPIPYNGGQKWVFTELPPLCHGSPSGHTDAVAIIVQSDNGIAASCSHKRCKEIWNWRDLRQHYEPGCYDEKPKPASHSKPKPKPEKPKPEPPPDDEHEEGEEPETKSKAINEFKFRKALERGLFKIEKIPGDELIIRFELTDDPEGLGSYEIPVSQLKMPDAATEFFDNRFNIYIPTITKPMWVKTCDWIRYTAKRRPPDEERDMRRAVGYGLLKAMIYSVTDLAVYVAERNKDAPNYSGVFLYGDSLLVNFSQVLNKIRRDIVHDADRTQLSKVLSFCQVKRFQHRDRQKEFQENFHRFDIHNLDRLAALCSFESGASIIHLAQRNLERQRMGLGGMPTPEAEKWLQSEGAEDLPPPADFTGLLPPSSNVTYTGDMSETEEGDDSFDFGG